MQGYRYEHRLFALDEIMYPPEDSFSRLTPQQQLVDRAIRDALPDGDRLRGGSLYAWEDRDWALRAWQLRKSPYFYELEFDEADILFRSDLNHYTDALDAANNRSLFDDAVARYCNKSTQLTHHTHPRIELLIKHARVKSIQTL